jgi:hypothetical protein
MSLNLISSLVTSSVEETIYDERDYVNILTGADVYTLMNRINELLAVLQAQYAMDVVNKACVRSLEVTLGM